MSFAVDPGAVPVGPSHGCCQVEDDSTHWQSTPWQAAGEAFRAPDVGGLGRDVAAVGKASVGFAFHAVKEMAWGQAKATLG